MKQKMRKIKNQLILLFILLLGCYSSTIAQNLVVSGITNPTAANGVYVPNGDLYGYASWKHESAEYYIYNDDYAGRYWNIDVDIYDSGTGQYVLFYSTNVSTAPSPVGLPFSPDNGAGNPVITEQVASAPTASTNAASSISTTSSTLNGTINANGASTTVTFQYGLTTSYGTTVTADQSPVTGTTNTSVSKAIGSLSPYTTYHYRVVGANSEGTTYGSDQSFTTLAQAATITTQAVSSISTTTATGNGNITSLGVPNPTQHGVCWNTGGTPTTSDSKTQEGAVSATGAFTSNITSLNPNTTYYVRAYVTNTAGTSYGSEVSFTTNPLAATVTTQAVSSISTTTATGNGNITNLGVPNPTQHGVCWNTGGTPTTSDSKTQEGAVSATGAFTSSITSLNPNTTYYVRAYATNTAGTSYGSEVSFTTNPLAATVTTQAVSSISTTTATGNGNITNLGVPNPTQHGVCWNTGGTPTTSDNKTQEGAVSATGTFTSSITSLNPNTTYYVRAYATNTAGTSYGSEVSFTTNPLSATVTTQAVSSISTTTATGNGNITDLGAPNPTQHGFCYNKTGSPTLSDSHVDMGAVLSTGAFSTTINFLDPNTTYYLKAYVTNTAGTVYGDEVSFTTLPEAATVTTQAVSSISTTTATGNGNITSLGVPNPTQHGVCWNTGGTPTTSDNKTEEGTVSATGAFTSSMTSLISNTTYYVRAYATNTAGTSYGSEVSFATLAEAPSATTNAASELTAKTVTLNGTVNANNASTTVSFEYGVTTGYGTTVAANESPVTGTLDTPVSVDLSSLAPNTTYHYRVVGVNSGGTTNGSDLTFTTLSQDPIVTTNAATSIGLNAATLNGTINANDLSTTVTFEYGLTDSYGTTVTADQSPVTGISNTAVSVDISGLTSNTTYHFRVIGQNSEATVNGDDQTFTTLAMAPTATTNSATDITANDAVLNGTINANDISTTVTFEYGLTTDYGNSISADQNPVTGNSDTPVSADLSELAPNTVYHFRVVGLNAGGTSNGDDQTFTTNKYAQTITFAGLPDKTTNDADFAPGAYSSLQLPISYTSSNEQVATIVNDQIHIIGAGTADITALQEGNDTVNAATPVVQKLTITQATGINDSELAHLKMFPNPAKDVLNIDLGNIVISNNLAISIIDIAGKIIYCNNFENSKCKIDVSNLSSGLYLVEIKTSNNIEKLKLIIK